jgi:predicted ribonucleotide reductase-associated flavodoxin
MDNAIIIYHSYTGNTEEVAEIIQKQLLSNGIQVDIHRVGSGAIPDPANYDICFVGTFTWEEGSLPKEIEDYLDYSVLPSNTAIFGTGDTQFGKDSTFCRAVNIIANKYGYKYIPLKIEQSPRGAQEKKVVSWTQQIININKGDASFE